ncbi:hypothetical protein PCANC_01059 [Puccinia coronata f. sp. avenae]|uniref:Uncharacterized protein n=1 Tax=Puccinia coronata f. sp. avenae TaxID=200324 RepID=A0A2N5W5U2_9BASI|nr:hypothetical protein PCANC_01059 [Puccinia coronata f. sp. avenae]
MESTRSLNVKPAPRKAVCKAPIRPGPPPPDRETSQPGSMLNYANTDTCDALIDDLNIQGRAENTARPSSTVYTLNAPLPPISKAGNENGRVAKPATLFSQMPPTDPNYKRPLGSSFSVSKRYGL